MFKNLHLALGNNANNSYYLLMDEISQESTKEVIHWILEANMADDKPGCLNLLICSQGGDLHAAFALIDIMAGSSIPVRTIGLGQIASAGLFIFMAGQKGYRVLTPNTTIMSHQYTAGNIGKEHELMATIKEFKLVSERVIAHYKKHTGLTLDVIKAKLLPPQDIYLSAKEALALGVCDVVKELK